MRVLVCGSREWDDPEAVNRVLGGYRYAHLNLTIIEGGARGADRMAGDWAVAADVDFEEYAAQWDVYGKAAGFVRNRQMLEEGKPDVCWAFGRGKGTDMMVDLCVKAGVPTYRVIREESSA